MREFYRWRTPRTWVVVTILVLGAGYLTNCKRRVSNDLQVKITNSIEVPEQDRLPGVVRIGFPGICTGVVVGPNAILTAAHCAPFGRDDFEKLDMAFSLMAGNGDKYDLTGTFMRHPGYVESLAPHGIPHYSDIAVIILRDPLPDSIPPVIIRTTPLENNETIKLVGYGLQTRSRTGEISDVQRIGINSYKRGIIGNILLSADISNGVIRYQGVAAASEGVAVGTQSLNAFGDSGGPLFDDQDRLIGITRGHLFSDDAIAIYLQFDSVQRFIKNAIDIGARLPLTCCDCQQIRYAKYDGDYEVVAESVALRYKVGAMESKTCKYLEIDAPPAIRSMVAGPYSLFKNCVPASCK